MAFGFGVGIQRLGSVGVNTLADLNGLPAPGAGIRPTGFVYADPTVSNNGVYTWNGTGWSKSRGLPDQVARMTVTGGTANAIVATAQPGVDPATTLMVLLTPNASNTAAVTLNGKPVKSRSGADLISGALTAGALYALVDLGTEYRVFLNNFADIADVAGLQAALDAKANASAVADALALKADADPTAAALNNRLRFDAAQSKTLAERGQARANIGAGVLAGFRNKLINGAAEFFQRGSRSIAAGASAYVFDRFFITNNTNQAVTVSQNVLALGSGFARDARRTMRFNFAAAPTTGSLRIEQRVEFVDSNRPGDWTFIGWMSGPSGSEAVAAEFVQNFGTGGSPSAQVVTPMTFAGGSPTTIFSASTNRRAWGVTVPSLSGKLLGTNANDFAAAAIVMTPRQAGNYDLTWLSLVEGDATSEDDPFAARHPQQELALCQRYFERTPRYYFQYTSLAGAGISNPVHFKVRKRAAPTIVAVFENFINTSTPSVVQPNVDGFNVYSLADANAGSVRVVEYEANADAEL